VLLLGNLYGRTNPEELRIGDGVERFQKLFLVDEIWPEFAKAMEQAQGQLLLHLFGVTFRIEQRH